MNICKNEKCNKQVKGNYKFCYNHFLKTYNKKCVYCTEKISSTFELCYDCFMERPKPKQKCLF